MTIIFKSPGVTVPGLTKLQRDPIITAGSKYLYDFEDAYCNPHARSGAIAAGGTFRNLVDGGASGVVFGANVQNGAAGKGIKLPGVNDHGVDFGTSYDTGQNAVLIIIWLMTRTGDAPAANSHIFGRDSSSGSGQYFITGGGDGKTLNISLGLNGALATSIQAAGSHALTVDAPQQFAFFWNGDTRSGWKNGVLGNTLSNAASTMNSGTTWTEGLGRKTTAGTTNVLGFNTGWQGSVFRVYKEDVTSFSSDPTTRQNWAAAQVLADYQNNIGRFS